MKFDCIYQIHKTCRLSAFSTDLVKMCVCTHLLEKCEWSSSKPAISFVYMYINIYMFDIKHRGIYNFLNNTYKYCFNLIYNRNKLRWVFMIKWILMISEIFTNVKQIKWSTTLFSLQNTLKPLFKSVYKLANNLK